MRTPRIETPHENNRLQGVRYFVHQAVPPLFNPWRPEAPENLCWLTAIGSPSFPVHRSKEPEYVGIPSWRMAQREVPRMQPCMARSIGSDPPPRLTPMPENRCHPEKSGVNRRSTATNHRSKPITVPFPHTTMASNSSPLSRHRRGAIPMTCFGMRGPRAWSCAGTTGTISR
jgi:hypothetical protein